MTTETPPNPTAPKPSPRSRAFPVVLGLVTAAIGGFFCFHMASAYLRIKATHEWPEVPCLITRSHIVEFQPVPNVSPRYRLDVEFFYEFEGQSLQSNLLRSRERTTTKRDQAEQWQARFPAGSEAICHVNPDDPSHAVLELESLAVGYTIWFPGLFVVGGLGMAWRALRRQ